VIECVPNLSEGRDAGSIERIADVVRSFGCQVLDVHRDQDHHRSVLTIIGAPAVIVRGVVSMVEAAIPLIDMRRHRGQHPRMGAVDVVPFVPIRGNTLADCVAVAQEAGAAIGDRLKIPVFLYEAAASKPERRNLAAVRRRRSVSESERPAKNRTTAPPSFIRRPEPSRSAHASSWSPTTSIWRRMTSRSHGRSPLRSAR